MNIDLIRAHQLALHKNYTALEDHLYCIHGLFEVQLVHENNRRYKKTQQKHNLWN